MYEVRKWNAVKNEWSYYNTFATYGEAVEEAERLERVFKGQFRVFTKQKGERKMFNFDKEDLIVMALMLAFGILFAVGIGALTHTL